MKEQLGIASDKAIAELLGLSPTGFADRKRRNTFPSEKLYALAAQRLDLGLDVSYVLTGETQHQRAVGSVASVAITTRDDLKRAGRVSSRAKEPAATYRALADPGGPSTSGAGLTGAEKEHLKNLRHCLHEDRDTIIRLAERLATTRKPKG